MSTKVRRRQNICVDKIYVRTNVSACADYVHIRRSIFLLFLPGKVCSSQLLPDLTDVLLLEDVVLSLCSHHVTGCRWPPRFYGWTLSHTEPAHMYRPTMQKCHKILASIKYQHLPRFHWFSSNFKTSKSVPRRLFFAAQQRIAMTLSPNYYKKIQRFTTRKNQEEHGPDVM